MVAGKDCVLNLSQPSSRFELSIGKILTCWRFLLLHVRFSVYRTHTETCWQICHVSANGPMGSVRTMSHSTSQWGVRRPFIAGIKSALAQMCSLVRSLGVVVLTPAVIGIASLAAARQLQHNGVELI